MSLTMDFNRLSKNEKLQFYIDHLKPVLNRAALFTDGTKEYRSYERVEDGYRATLKFRTAKYNVEAVYVLIGDRRYRMMRSSSDRLFDYYSTTVLYNPDSPNYCFQILAGKTVVYYNKRGVLNDHQDYYDYRMVPEFETPDWAKGAVFYQIFVDRFYNADPSNDVCDREYIYIHEYSSKVKDWYQYPDAMDVRRFYGGDLQGVYEKLDYLHELGVDVIYFNPIFVSPSNHKYDIQDYDYVDPHFGKIIKDDGEPLPDYERSNYHASKYIRRVTDKENLEAGNQLFATLVDEIHKRGMRVILDGVFNHCGSFNKWLDREQIYENVEGYDKGAFVSAESPYRSFFKFYNENNWPYNGDYDGWWGHDTLPKLNYEESQKLYDYIINIAKKWLMPPWLMPPFNIDGWRLDVAADLGHSIEFNNQFWRDLRIAVKSVNPEAIILAEHYGDPASWLQGDQWDTVMNYDAFMEPITWFLTGVEKHSDEYREDLYGNEESFRNAMTHHMSRFHHESLFTAMNELSNHDHSRFLTRTNHMVGRTGTRGAEAANWNINKGIFREAVVMQMTWPGAPTIYYGDEAGLCGWTDPDNRRTYPWGREDQELISFHKDIIRIHKASRALCKGSVKFLYGAYQTVAYGRFTKNEQVVILINNKNEPQTITIPVWEIGVTNDKKMVSDIITTENGYRLEAQEYDVNVGMMTVPMEKYSSIVLHAK